MNRGEPLKPDEPLELRKRAHDSLVVAKIVTGREEMRSRKALTSAAPSGFANHCMLFFTKICIAVQPIAQARSMADATPPAVETCAPRSGSSFCVCASPA